MDQVPQATQQQDIPDTPPSRCEDWKLTAQFIATVFNTSVTVGYNTALLIMWMDFLPAPAWICFARISLGSAALASVIAVTVAVGEARYRKRESQKIEYAKRVSQGDIDASPPGEISSSQKVFLKATHYFCHAVEVMQTPLFIYEMTGLEAKAIAYAVSVFYGLLCSLQEYVNAQNVVKSNERQLLSQVDSLEMGVPSGTDEAVSAPSVKYSVRGRQESTRWGCRMWMQGVSSFVNTSTQSLYSVSLLLTKVLPAQWQPENLFFANVSLCAVIIMSPFAPCLGYAEARAHTANSETLARAANSNANSGVEEGQENGEVILSNSDEGHAAGHFVADTLEMMETPLFICKMAVIDSASKGWQVAAYVSVVLYGILGSVQEYVNTRNSFKEKVSSQRPGH